MGEKLLLPGLHGKKIKIERKPKNNGGNKQKHTSRLESHQSQSQCNSRITTVRRSNRYKAVPSPENQTQKSRKPIMPILWLLSGAESL